MPTKSVGESQLWSTMVTVMVKLLLLLLVCLNVLEALRVGNIAVHRVPLRNSRDGDNVVEGATMSLMPFCYAVSSPLDLDPRRDNFLATQVWPSARVAATVLLEQYASDRQTSSVSPFIICEFGCGPGLPSLTAAAALGKRVIATDRDAFALELVNRAAVDQGIEHLVTTRVFDLIESSLDQVPPAELYILSDVFESDAVARGAARVCDHVLSTGSSVWVFAQSDRSQRETFLSDLRQRMGNLDLTWTPLDQGPPPTWNSNNVWLCDIDETKVSYG